MSESADVVKVVFTSDSDEDFLLADIEIAGNPCFQVLKRSEDGPVSLAFFTPGTRQETLVSPESLINAIRKAVDEIKALRITVESG